MRTQPRGRQNAVKISALAAKAQPPAPAHAEDDLSSFAQPAPRMLPVLHRQRRGARGTPSVGLPAAICLARLLALAGVAVILAGCQSGLPTGSARSQVPIPSATMALMSSKGM